MVGSARPKQYSRQQRITAFFDIKPDNLYI